MKIVNTIDEVRKEVKDARSEGRTIGFVPTMGFLHEGHLSLVSESTKRSDYQVMSIFVNPTQFNDPKDLESYPVDLEQDFALARERGVDLIFVPNADEMYKNAKTYVDMDDLTDHLCGAHRPGHFRGVFTVVSKLFNIVLPDVAVFGQKDIQQVVSIERMVADLNFPVEIVISPTVREESGLAMSSRNKHLTDDEREQALVIVKSLQAAEAMILKGETEWAKIRQGMEEVLVQGNPGEIDYITAVDYENLAPTETIDGKSVIAVAAFFGKTRLIDNMVIDFKDGNGQCIY